MERKHIRQRSDRYIIRWFGRVCYVFIIVGIQACHNDANQDSAYDHFTSEYELEILKRLDSINRDSDVAKKIYLTSIDLMKRDYSASDLKEMYQDSIDVLRENINEQLNEVNELYRERHISDNDFKSFKSKLDFRELKTLSEELDRMGVKY